MPNTNNVTTDQTAVTKNAIGEILASLLGTEYNLDKIATLVGMKDYQASRKSHTFHISTFESECTVEETVVTDNFLTLTEGRYIDDIWEHSNDSDYHYIYLDCAAEDWRIKLSVDSCGNLVGIKEIRTLAQAIKFLSDKFVGKRFDEYEVENSIFLEDKGENLMQNIIEGGRTEINTWCMCFCSPVMGTKGIIFVYDDNGIVSYLLESHISNNDFDD